MKPNSVMVEYFVKPWIEWRKTKSSGVESDKNCRD